MRGDRKWAATGNRIAAFLDGVALRLVDQIGAVIEIVGAEIVLTADAAKDAELDAFLGGEILDVGDEFGRACGGLGKDGGKIALGCFVRSRDSASMLGGFQ